MSWGECSRGMRAWSGERANRVEFGPWLLFRTVPFNSQVHSRYSSVAECPHEMHWFKHVRIFCSWEHSYPQERSNLRQMVVLQRSTVNQWNILAAEKIKKEGYQNWEIGEMASGDGWILVVALRLRSSHSLTCPPLLDSERLSWWHFTLSSRQSVNMVDLSK